MLAKLPPPYCEDDGDLVLESLWRRMGSADTDAPPVAFNKMQSARVTRFLELREEKNVYDTSVKLIEGEMKRLKALIVADMGKSCSAVTEDGDTIIWKSFRKPAMSKENLVRLKEAHPDIYEEYVTFSESRRFDIKQPKPEAA